MTRHETANYVRLTSDGKTLSNINAEKLNERRTMKTILNRLHRLEKKIEDLERQIKSSL